MKTTDIFLILIVIWLLFGSGFQKAETFLMTAATKLQQTPGIIYQTATPVKKPSSFTVPSPSVPDRNDRSEPAGAAPVPTAGVVVVPQGLPNLPTVTPTAPATEPPASSSWWTSSEQTAFAVQDATATAGRIAANQAMTAQAPTQEAVATAMAVNADQVDFEDPATQPTLLPDDQAKIQAQCAAIPDPVKRGWLLDQMCKALEGK